MAGGSDPLSTSNVLPISLICVLFFSSKDIARLAFHLASHMNIKSLVNILFILQAAE